MQKINLIAQKRSSYPIVKKSDDDEDEDDDDNDTHQGWIIVRDGMYSVADKNKLWFKRYLTSLWLIGTTNSIYQIKLYKTI